LECGGCGAGFGPGQLDAPGHCPLCGLTMGGLTIGESEIGASKKIKPPVDEDEYRSNVRELREELQRLRRGEAEAV
ncbi:MAG TPA: hypothetical protein VFS18_03105, partial [Actinomycetota bacterium]|nr:hypothetical protein [Actinomycetota bacterium]